MAAPGAGGPVAVTQTHVSTRVDGNLDLDGGDKLRRVQGTAPACALLSRGLHTIICERGQCFLAAETTAVSSLEVDEAAPIVLRGGWLDNESSNENSLSEFFAG